VELTGNTPNSCVIETSNATICTRTDVKLNPDIARPNDMKFSSQFCRFMTAFTGRGDRSRLLVKETCLSRVFFPQYTSRQPACTHRKTVMKMLKSLLLAIFLVDNPILSSSPPPVHHLSEFLFTRCLLRQHSCHPCRLHSLSLSLSLSLSIYIYIYIYIYIHTHTHTVEVAYYDHFGTCAF
jgi:dolichol kinase